MNTEHPLQLVIFDCDGTLVDSQHAIIAAMRAAFDAFGLAHPADDAVRGVVGLPLTDAVARLHPDGDATAHGAIAECYKAAFFEHRSAGLHQDSTYPGAHAALDRLEAAGLLLAVATGKSRRGLDATLDRHGLGGRFVSLQTADSVAAGKPAPDMALQAMADAGVAPEHAVVVGDTVFDVHMARAAGARAVGVAWGYHPVDQLRAAGVAAVVDEFAGLADVLAPLFGRSAL